MVVGFPCRNKTGKQSLPANAGMVLKCFVSTISYRGPVQRLLASAATLPTADH
jgi:hypothetical protein